MKKILIVTLWDYLSFGNRLQALALKEMIEELGYSAVYAVYKKGNLSKSIKRILKEYLGWLGIDKYHKVYCKKIRVSALRADSHMFVPRTKTIYHYDVRNKINPKQYAAAVTGSDQVWHHWDGDNELEYFYLSFMPSEKRISYAASFGFDDFPTDDLEQHRVGLSKMRFVSCREKTGCALVERIAGKQSMLVLDPTLCVGVDYWRSVEIKPDFINPSHSYLLVFLLGKHDEYNSKIEEYSEHENLEIIDLHDDSRVDIWRTTLGGFLWLIHHADMICTDSFHCSVFSILYEKPFQVFRRQQVGYENMYNRIETLLELTGLEACHYDGKEVRKVDVDYKYAKCKIDIDRKKSILWLNNALKVVGDEQDQSS